MAIVKKLALVGIGLIGSSIALGARKFELADEISVSTRSIETLKRAEQLGLGDSFHENAADAVNDADLVIISVPVGASGAVAEAIAPALKPGAIVSDAGSVKQSVVNQMAPVLPDHVHFVPGHPIAGTENSGPESGFATLFENRWTVLTPGEDVDIEATQTLSRFWRGLGSNVEIMSAEHHDLVLAITSHIPHLIAYNIVGTASDLEGKLRSEVVKFSASGFRDFTRIAASDPVMWRDVFLHNKTAVLETLGRFSEDLSVLQRAIRDGDGEFLFDLFTRTRDIRTGIIEAGQEVEAANFGRYTADDTSTKT